MELGGSGSPIQFAFRSLQSISDCHAFHQYQSEHKKLKTLNPKQFSFSGAMLARIRSLIFVPFNRCIWRFGFCKGLQSLQYVLK